MINAKLRKYKKKQFRQQIIDKLDTFQSNNQKEYWNLVNSLRESKRDNPEKSIDDEIWLAYFSELSTVPPKFDKKIEELNEKVKELEQKPEFKSEYLSNAITYSNSSVILRKFRIFCLKYWSNVPLRPDLRINARCKNCIE
jgi:hypothetical protein